MCTPAAISRHSGYLRRCTGASDFPIGVTCVLTPCGPLYDDFVIFGDERGLRDPPGGCLCVSTIPAAENSLTRDQEDVHCYNNTMFRKYSTLWAFLLITLSCSVMCCSSVFDIFSVEIDVVTRANEEYSIAKLDIERTAVIVVDVWVIIFSRVNFPDNCLSLVFSSGTSSGNCCPTLFGQGKSFYLCSNCFVLHQWLSVVRFQM